MDGKMSVKVKLIDEMWRLVWPDTEEIILDHESDEPIDEGGHGRKKFALVAAQKAFAGYDEVWE